ncbi:hypothetical protein [Roseivivax sp.]
MIRPALATAFLLLALGAPGLGLAPAPAHAEGAAPAPDKAFSLALPAELAESGLPDHLLPRFSLKTATRITRQPGTAEGADARFTREGPALFTGPGGPWALVLAAPEDPDARAFADWLASEAGRATIAGYAPEGGAPFTPGAPQRQAKAAPELAGEARRGAKRALALCGRCHVVGEVNRMKAIGSTPSFAMLRTLPDWARRFRSFFALAPHPAFTQVAEVTPPFDPARPSPIAPLEMTLTDIEDILAFVAALPPADLGAPVQSR